MALTASLPKSFSLLCLFGGLRILRVEILEQVAQEFRGTSGNDQRDADSCGGVLCLREKFAVDHDGGTIFVSHFGFSCFLDVVLLFYGFSGCPCAVGG